MIDPHVSLLRRTFLKAGLTAAATTVGLGRAAAAPAQTKVPSYLVGYEKRYSEAPRKAAQAWFADAKFGLFMHYGLYSLLGRGEWVMFHEKIHVAEYEKLKPQFTAKNFDADKITDLALDAGMKYINLTARHHDGFCLFETATQDYHSVASPAKRDLIGELTDQCAKKGLGMFAYYSYGADWRHPYFYPNEYCRMARPHYSEPEARYKWEKPEDFQHYLDYAHTQIRELLTNYRPLAGIWFDPIMPYYAKPEWFPIDETYAMVRKLQPQVLISYKQGANGTEDFAAPERSGASLADRVAKQGYGPESVAIARKAWGSNQSKHNEICDTMQPHVWGYQAADDGKHDTPEVVVEKLAAAARQNCNLLLNTGPLPDGSIHAGDAATLRAVGKRIRQDGWPEAKS